MKTISKEDFTLFHLGRILYLQGKNAESQEKFARILSDHANSPHAEEARSYIRLLAARSTGQ